MFKRISALLLAAVLIFGLAGITLATTPDTGVRQQTELTVQDVDLTHMDKVERPAVTVAAAEPQQEAPVEAPVVQPEPAPEPEPEVVTSNFYLDGQPIQGMTLKVYDGVLYAGLRTFFENTLATSTVTWDRGTSTATVKGTTASGESLTVTARKGECYVVANDRYLYVAGGVKLEGGVTLVPLSVLTKVFTGSTVKEGATTEHTEVSVGTKLLANGASFYNSRDLDLISRVINCEAGNQSLRGKIAVGNIIMNRVNSSRFPNNVYDVLYAKGQFTIVKYAIFQRTPSAQSVLAAKFAMEGTNMVPGAVYYCQKGLKCWMSRNCPLLYTIEGHDFYGV